MRSPRLPPPPSRLLCTSSRIAGEHRWSGIGIALLIVGGVLQGAVVGAEITLAAVVNSGLDVLAVLIEAETWTRPLFMGAMALFVMGWLSFAAAFRKVPILPPARNRLAIAFMVAILIGTFIPQTTGTYLLGVAILVARPGWLGSGPGTGIRQGSLKGPGRG